MRKAQDSPESLGRNQSPATAAAGGEHTLSKEKRNGL